VDRQTLDQLDRQLRELRANLSLLEDLGHDTSEDEALLVQLELLLAAVRKEKGGGPSDD
jgi:hypothetical protein